MRLAIIVDGGFILRIALKKHGLQFENTELADALHKWLTRTLPESLGEALNREIFLFRIYYYDCYPYIGTIKNPFNGVSKESRETQRTVFLDTLSRKSHVFFKAGRLSISGWKVKDLNKKVLEQTALSGDDMEPQFQQKGIDVQISLDVGQLVHQKSVDSLIFITGDSDFVPIMNHARQQGVLVYLCHLGRPLSQELLAANDMLLTTEYDGVSYTMNGGKSVPVNLARVNQENQYNIS